MRPRGFLPLLLLIIAGASQAATFAHVSSLTQRLKAIEKVRQRSFHHPVEQKTISRTEFRSYLRSQFGKDLNLDPTQYLSILEAAHFIAPGRTTFEKLLDLYDAQVLAFYDPEKHIYYSLDEAPEGTSMSPVMGETVAIHELMHALQDQHFEIGNTMAKLRGKWDAQSAYHAVIEGEATFVMMAAMFELMGKSVDDIVRDETILAAMAASASTDGGFGDTDEYFVESMKFPYMDGLRFVIEAYKRGGWKAIDDLHRDPPRSTEQILHPQLYFDAAVNVFASEPVELHAERTIDKPLFSGSVGEFAFRFLLGEKAADGWRGDDMAIYGAGAKKLVIVQSEWDSDEDANEFATAYVAFLRKHGHADVRSVCIGRSVHVSYGGTRAQRRKFRLEP